MPRGVFAYLYLMVGRFLRNVVGWRVREAGSIGPPPEPRGASPQAGGADGAGPVVRPDDGGPERFAR